MTERPLTNAHVQKSGHATEQTFHSACCGPHGGSRNGATQIHPGGFPMLVNDQWLDGESHKQWLPFFFEVCAITFLTYFDNLPQTSFLVMATHFQTHVVEYVVQITSERTGRLNDQLLDYVCNLTLYVNKIHSYTFLNRQMTFNITLLHYIPYISYTLKKTHVEYTYCRIAFPH